MRRQAFAGPLLAAWAGGALAQDGLRVASYALDVSFSPVQHSMRGSAEITFAAVPAGNTELVFYLHGELEVEAAKLGGQGVEVEQEPALYGSDYSLVATRVRVPLAGRDVRSPLRVRYAGVFNPSRARSPSDYMRIDADGVFLRSYGYSLWFPVFLEAGRDDYLVSFPRVVIRTPREFVPVFVGTHLGDSLAGEERVSEWSAEDVPLFAAQCTAQRFAVLSEGGYRAYSWEDPRSKEKARSILAFVKKLDALYRARYRGSASAGQLHIMQMPDYGDISSGNVVGLTSGVWSGLERDASAQRTLGHELVHPFVWVPTERSDPLFALAVEGFPSYFHLPVLEELLGEDFYSTFLRRIETLYLEKRASGRDRRRRPLPPEKPLLAIGADEVGLYKDEFVLSDRALLFLDDLRRRMGEQPFRDFGRELTNLERLDRRRFEQLMLKYLPGAREDLRLWLETTEFPERFRLRQPGAAKQVH